MNDRIKLDQNFKKSFIGEIAKVSTRSHGCSKLSLIYKTLPITYSYYDMRLSVRARASMWLYKQSTPSYIFTRATYASAAL